LLEEASIKVATPFVVIAPDPLPTKTSPEVKEFFPVPPLDTPRVPVTPGATEL
jgi:hypothetical protein